MNKKMTKRSFIKKTIASILTITSFGISSRAYAEYIEPYWIDITHHTISNKLLPKGFSGTKIVQFSDTHLGFQYNLKQLKKTVKKINDLNPDIVVFTGDLMDKPDDYNNQDVISNLLFQIQAPLGKFCIYGNHDHGGNGTSAYEKIMSDSGFVLLQNTNATVVNQEKEKIYIAGIDEPMLGSPEWETTFNDITDSEYCVLLAHAPDFADRAHEYPVILQISGHSHGGQVRVPILGALITPPFAKKYIEGMYEVSSLKLYVNRGLGTTRLPLRFLSRPEITTFTLESLQ